MGGTRTGRSAPKGTLNAARWSEIIVAAAEVFAEKGFVAATMQDVASRVGLLAGSLYYYVENKEDLLFAVAERAHAESLAWLGGDDSLATGDAPTRMARFVARWMQPRPTVGHPMPAERDYRFLRPDQRHRITAMRNELGDVVRVIVCQGIAEGSFDRTIEPSAAVNTVVQLLVATERWFRPSPGFDRDDLVAWCTAFVLRGLGCPEGTAGAEVERSRPPRVDGAGSRLDTGPAGGGPPVDS